MRTGIRRLAVLPAVFVIRLYQVALSPLLPSACRYTPTCSQYFIDALRTWGPIRGTALGVRRVLRCHPLAPGGHDPVPERPAPGPGRGGPPARDTGAGGASSFFAKSGGDAKVPNRSRLRR